VTQENQHRNLQERLQIIMGRLSNESFEEFLQSLKEAGIVITNEEELREALDRGNKKLAEAVMLRILPNHLLTKINSVELQWGASLNHNWGI
jgi:FtsZ-binding cell division protein ZapB